MGVEDKGVSIDGVTSSKTDWSSSSVMSNSVMKSVSKYEEDGFVLNGSKFTTRRGAGGGARVAGGGASSFCIISA